MNRRGFFAMLGGVAATPVIAILPKAEASDGLYATGGYVGRVSRSPDLVWNVPKGEHVVVTVWGSGGAGGSPLSKVYKGADGREMRQVVIDCIRSQTPPRHPVCRR